MLLLLGLAAVVSQLAQISPLLESYPGWTLNSSNIQALALGGVLLTIGRTKVIKKLVHFSLFSGQEVMKRFLFAFPFFATLILALIKLRLGNSSDYRVILGEGGFIEYGTVIAYYLAAGFAIPIGRYFFQLGQKGLAWGYYLYSAFFIFVALEEVSWGQRLFGWELPSFLEAYNAQEEFTIHNLVWFHKYSGEAIIVISFICLLGLFFLYRSRQSHQTKGSLYLLYLFPRWFLASFFGLAMIIFILIEFFDGLGFFISADQEFAELLLSLGFLFLVIVNYFRQVFEFEYSKPGVEERQSPV